MNGKIIYGFYYSKYAFRILINKITRKKIKVKYHKKVLNGQEGNDFIYSQLCQKKPWVAARFGSTELHLISSVIGERLGLRKVSDGLMWRIVNWSGFFPNEKKQMEKLTDLYIEACSAVDTLGVWNDRMEDYITKYNMTSTNLLPLTSFEPYYHNNPWSRALKGKKVLVVHPFADSIRSQYKKRDKIFSEDILPEFTLYTVKAVQTIAGQKDDRFDSWFDALEYMYQEAMEFDFDIALIACGAYGMPLAVKLKHAGKQVIHMGGSLQILFGIKGARWDNNPHINCFYNENWIRPGEDERPKESSVVEDGCYW